MLDELFDDEEEVSQEKGDGRQKLQKAKEEVAEASLYNPNANVENFMNKSVIKKKVRFAE